MWHYPKRDRCWSTAPDTQGWPRKAWGRHSTQREDLPTARWPSALGRRSGLRLGHIWTRGSCEWLSSWFGGLEKERFGGWGQAGLQGALSKCKDLCVLCWHSGERPPGRERHRTPPPEASRLCPPARTHVHSRRTNRVATVEGSRLRVAPTAQAPTH